MLGQNKAAEIVSVVHHSRVEPSITARAPDERVLKSEVLELETGLLRVGRLGVPSLPDTGVAMAFGRERSKEQACRRAPVSFRALLGRQSSGLLALEIQHDVL